MDDMQKLNWCYNCKTGFNEFEKQFDIRLRKLADLDEIGKLLHDFLAKSNTKAALALMASATAEVVFNYYMSPGLKMKMARKLWYLSARLSEHIFMRIYGGGVTRKQVSQLKSMIVVHSHLQTLNCLTWIERSRFTHHRILWHRLTVESVQFSRDAERFCVDLNSVIYYIFVLRHVHLIMLARQQGIF